MFCANYAKFSKTKFVDANEIPNKRVVMFTDGVRSLVIAVLIHVAFIRKHSHDKVDGRKNFACFLPNYILYVFVGRGNYVI